MDFLEGKVEFVLTGFILCNLVIDASLVFLLPWATGNLNAQFIAEVVKQLCIVVLLPAFLAVLTRLVFRKINRPVPKMPGMVTFSIWCSMLFVISAQTTVFFQQHRDIALKQVILIALLSLVLCAINFTLGKLLGGKNFSRESSQTLGQKNTTLTVFLALCFGTPESALGPTFYILWHNVWNAFQMYRHDSLKQQH
jgi:BASS family bile acid:Na+ symporter